MGSLFSKNQSRIEMKTIEVQQLDDIKLLDIKLTYLPKKQIWEKVACNYGAGTIKDFEKEKEANIKKNKLKQKKVDDKTGKQADNNNKNQKSNNTKEKKTTSNDKKKSIIGKQTEPAKDEEKQQTQQDEHLQTQEDHYDKKEETEKEKEKKMQYEKHKNLLDEKVKEGGQLLSKLDHLKKEKLLADIHYESLKNILLQEENKLNDLVSYKFQHISETQQHLPIKLIEEKDDLRSKKKMKM